MFLIHHKQSWPEAWDSMIDSCHSSKETDNTAFEDEYEKLSSWPSRNVSTGITVLSRMSMILPKRLLQRSLQRRGRTQRRRRTQKRTKKTDAFDTDETVPDNTTAAQTITTVTSGAIEAFSEQEEK